MFVEQRLGTEQLEHGVVGSLVQQRGTGVRLGSSGHATRW
ncbi:hypothetical protein MMUC44124_00555 [Mycolicibacterium mucogenicum DSM 44124]|nr:hypothetical protein MMUC44124_00555 [Mycolicibacterium mucogenicum DSM 44124]